MKNILTLAALIVLSSCFPNNLTYVRRYPTYGLYEASKQHVIWNKAVLHLQHNKYPLILLDAASGTITTGTISAGYKQCNIDGYQRECETRQNLSLTVSPLGQAICNINREYYVDGLHRWVDAEYVPGAILDVQNEQQQILNAITR